MLIIHGTTITSADAEPLNRAFGLCYEREKVTDRIIIWYINDTHTHRFPSMSKFVQAVFSKGIDEKTLTIQYTHPTHPGPYRIHMQGSRTGDYHAANRKAQLSATPDSFTWHHKEGIIKAGSGYECDMYLIASDYHGRVKHRGGVYEYERLTGRKYQ